jgi:hypothetical protein
MPTIHPDLRPVCDEHTSLLCNWHSYRGFSQVTNEFVDSRLIRIPSERTTLSNEELLDSISEGSTVEFVIEQRSVGKCHSSCFTIDSLHYEVLVGDVESPSLCQRRELPYRCLEIRQIGRDSGPSGWTVLDNPSRYSSMLSPARFPRRHFEIMPVGGAKI